MVEYYFFVNVDHCALKLKLRKLEYGNAGEEPGPMVVTELPKEMFKKPRLRNDFGQNSGDHGNENQYKPVFSKRNSSKIAMSQGTGIVASEYNRFLVF